MCAKEKKSLGERVWDFFACVGDKIKLAFIGVIYCLKKPKYLAIWLISWFVFLYILTFFQDGSGNWALIISGIGIDQKLNILGKVLEACLNNFLNLYGLLLIAMSMLQGISVMLMVYTWKHRNKDAALSGASTSTVASALGFVALGCPSCGISLLTPVLTAIAGASAGVLAEKIGKIFTFLAFFLLFFAIYRLGYLVFVIVTADKYKEKHAAKNS